MRTKPTLSIDDANLMLAASLAAARIVGRNVSIAIVDEAGGLLAFQRMDGARAHTIDLAQRKARIAAMLALPTAFIEAMNRERPPQTPDMVVGGGGLPAIHLGACAGALGVSGGKTEEDEAIARAGLDAIAAS